MVLEQVQKFSSDIFLLNDADEKCYYNLLFILVIIFPYITSTCVSISCYNDFYSALKRESIVI